MKKLLLTLSAFALTLGSAAAYGNTAWSSDTSLDTVSIKSGESFELQTTTPISYSTKWAYGYDRKITLTITENANTSGLSVLSAGDTHTIYESEGEEEGIKTWDYTAIDPSEFPRNASYDISYDITDAESGYSFTGGGVKGVATITITPEPGLCFALLLLGIAALRNR